MWHWKGEMPKGGDRLEVNGQWVRFTGNPRGLYVDLIDSISGVWVGRIGELREDGSLRLQNNGKLRKSFAEATCEWKVKAKKPITNRQWLAKMSDEELAEWLADHDRRIEEQAAEERDPDAYVSPMTAEQRLEWLKEEHHD